VEGEGREKAEARAKLRTSAEVCQCQRLLAGFSCIVNSLGIRMSTALVVFNGGKQATAQVLLKRVGKAAPGLFPVLHDCVGENGCDSTCIIMV